MGGGKIALLVAGVLVLLLTVGLFFGGAVLVWLNVTQTDNDGFFNTRAIDLERESYAVIVPSINIDADMAGIWEWRDLFAIKIEATSATGAIFLGIAAEENVNSFLDGVKHDEISNLNIRGDDIEITYITMPGTMAPGAPASQDFWLESASGAGIQSIEWSPGDAGRFVIVLMNEYASSGIDVSAVAGARVPILTGIGWGLIGGGVVGVAVGGLMLYLALRREQNATAAPQA